MAFQEEVAEKGYIDQAPMLREVREISEKIWQTKAKTFQWYRVDRSIGCLSRS